MKYTPKYLTTLTLTLALLTLPLPSALAKNTNLSTGEKLSGQRVMHGFDFEERDINFEVLPMHWQRVRSKPGFAHYATGMLDNQVARSGDYSFKLLPNGSSVGFEYNKKLIPVKSGNDFQITGYVHMERVKTCRAQLSCTLIDRAGRPIPQSIHLSEPMGPGHEDNDGWAKLQVYMPGNFADAAFISIGLWVLQEEQWQEDVSAKGYILRPDVKAELWFDDITIYQLPRVILRTDRKCNVFQPGQTATLEVEVAGVSSLDYEVELVVRDAAGKIVKRSKWMLAGIEGGVKVERIELPGLPGGLYHAMMSIMANNIVVSERELTFAQLSELHVESATSGRGFGVLVLDKDTGEWPIVWDLLKMIGSKLIKIPVWRGFGSDKTGIYLESGFDDQLIEMQSHGIEVVAVFSEVPETLAVHDSYGASSLLDVLSQPSHMWQAQVAFVLARYAMQIPYWQIGPEIDSSNEMWDWRIKPVIANMRSEFAALVDHAVLAAPLSAFTEVTVEDIGTDYVSLQIPSKIPPSGICEYVSSCRPRKLNHVWALIEPLNNNQYSRKNVLIDFAKRIAYAKRGLVDAIFVDHPWHRRRYNARWLVEPCEEYLVYRTLAGLLGGTDYAGELRLARDVVAMIFTDGVRGCLLIWNNGYDPIDDTEPLELKVYLGEDLWEVDLFGNRRKLAYDGVQAVLRPTQWPTLITGIDSHLAIMRASLKLVPDVVDATISTQKATLQLTNPFGSGISGKLQFFSGSSGRRNWQIAPGLLSFALQPGQTLERELSLKFPRNEVDGLKTLEALLTVDSTRTYRLNVRIPFEMRLSGIDFSDFTKRINDRDLLVQLVVTNETVEEVSLFCFVDLPDRDHLERAIMRLQPGSSVTKTFPIRNARQWLGKSIRVGLYDPKGTRRLSREILIR